MSSVKKKSGSIYNKNILTRQVVLKFNLIGSNIQEVLSNKLKRDLEGKCSKEGYVKKKSINILKYSSGMLIEDSVKYDVVFECLICNPVEGMKIKCVIKNIGIRYQLNDEYISVMGELLKKKIGRPTKKKFSIKKSSK